MSWDMPEVPIAATQYFDTLNGLWTGKKNPFVEAGVIRNTNFTPSGAIDYSNIAYLEVEAKQLLKRRLEAGDIILERSGGGPKQPVGRGVFFDREDGDFSFSNFTSAIRLKDKTKFDPRFVFYGLMELYQSGKTEDLQRRTTGIRNLDFSAYKERARFPSIPLPEQKKIAEILSTVQRAIEEQGRVIQTTTELKKALMQKLFTEGLRNEPQKQTEIGPVPDSWEVVDLGDVINLFAGYAFKSDEGISESNTQLLRMGNLYQNTLDLNRSPIFYPDSFAAAHKRFVLKEGDLVMSLTGTSGKEDYGFTVRIPKTDKTLLLNQRVTRIDVTDHRLQKDFAHHFLLSRKFLDHLYPTAKGMKQANLSTNAMKKIKVVLPGEAEQSEIAMCFKSLDQKVVVAGRKLAALQDLFRTLLHELMTAKTRIHAIDITDSNS